ncbi:ADP-ribosyltransferase-containing protein [Helicobacter sp. T3_23-1059]
MPTGKYIADRNFTQWSYSFKQNTTPSLYREMIEEAYDIHPAQEFGTNYAEFYKDGQGAIQKLLAEANAAKQAGEEFSGQVAGAFEKQIDGVLSDIDLVWGNEKMGLKHIVEKHGDDFAGFEGDKQADKIANVLSEIIEKGEVKATHNGYNIFYNDFKVGLNVGWNENGIKKGDNKWIVTAFDKSKSLSEKQGSNSVSFTKSETLPLNSNEQIIQHTAEKIQQKMQVSSDFAQNLAKWHKDSHAITKEADGTPKIFYHGSGADNITIFDKAKDDTGLGFWFSEDKDFAEKYHKFGGKNYETFLHIKNPLDLSPQSNLKEADFTRIFGKDFVEEMKKSWQIDDLFSNADKFYKILISHSYTNGAKNFVSKIQKAGYDGIYSVKSTTKNTKLPIAVVFDSNQIKAIDNKGTFDSSNPNIYHANATLGGGILGGSVAGLEYDENGNIKGFSPERFLAGFIAGGITSKATQAALKSPKLRQKALDFSQKAGEIITHTLKESNLPKHAQEALQIALGKRLANALDSRAWINEPKEAIKSLSKNAQDLLDKEQQAIYGVVYKGEHSATIYKDLAKIDEALKNTIALNKGYHNLHSDRGRGATHIKLHLEPYSEGYLSQNEMLDLGKNIREYINTYGSPFIDKRGARIYEWFNKEGDKFRVVVDNQRAGTTASVPADEEIITYFSDRFTKKGMNFHNERVTSDYEQFLSKKLDFYIQELQKITHNGVKYEDIDIDGIAHILPLRYLYDKSKQGNSIAKAILENFSTGNEGRGYSGYSMSNNAVYAYENGQKPLTKFTSEDAKEISDLTEKKWSVKEVKDFVKDYGEVGYHHTSKFYNKTYFYSIGKAFRNIAEDEPEYAKRLFQKKPEQNQKEINEFFNYVKQDTKMDEQKYLREKIYHFREKIDSHKYLKEKTRIEKEKTDFESKKKLGQSFMERLENISWYQNPTKHQKQKERNLEAEIKKALEILEWLQNKQYLKTIDELKTEGKKRGQIYLLQRLKYFEPKLKDFVNNI